ncbi:MAG: type II toxin-antitoxin system RelE/ParE family toxin [Candidatus Omnitrophica bacterium]|nr:type II toxin-antitoxin system RelE/ParE family toxin [Candidatus Omnitrophota bacterium]
MYKIFYTKEAKDQIDKYDKKLKAQLKKTIEKIAGNPSAGKRLMHELTGLQSYRTGNYRIIYRTYQQQILILVLAIGHRKDIYKRISR